MSRRVDFLVLSARLVGLLALAGAARFIIAAWVAERLPAGPVVPILAADAVAMILIAVAGWLLWP